MEVPGRKGQPATVMDRDEAPSRFRQDKLQQLRPAFAAGTEQGTVTAGNASPITDGAAALVLTSEAVAEHRGLKAGWTTRKPSLMLLQHLLHPIHERRAQELMLLKERTDAGGLLNFRSRMRRCWREYVGMQMRSMPQISSQQHRPQRLLEHCKLQGSPWQTWSTTRSMRHSVWLTWSIRGCWAWILKGRVACTISLAKYLPILVSDVSSTDTMWSACVP